MYSRMYDFIGEGKAYLTVLYNLGLITLLSCVLGLLMGKITDYFSRGEQPSTESSDNDGNSELEK